MTTEIQNKFLQLLSLVNNPFSDSNNIQQLKKELDWVNTANWSKEDWNLYNQVMN